MFTYHNDTVMSAYTADKNVERNHLPVHYTECGTLRPTPIFTLIILWFIS